MPNRLPQLRGCPASPGRQRGATLVFTAFTLVALVATLGLAVDVGRLYATQTQLQRTAEVAALDAARALGGCGVGTPSPPQSCGLGATPTEQDSAECAVDNAIANQSDDDGAPAISSDVVLGIQQTNGSLLTFQPSSQFDADSVQVTLERPAPTPLVAFFTADRPLTASATAISRPQAGISVGTAAIRIGGLDGSEGILAALLGTNQVNLISYDGLVDAELTVGDLLQADATIGGLNDLLTTDFTLPDSLNLIADALDNVTAGTNALAANTLRDLANLADTGLTSRLGQVLNIEPGLENVINALPVDVTSLLTGLAQAANQGAPVDLPVGIDLGGLASAQVSINIIEPPQIDFGRAGLDGDGKPRTVATTAQAAIQVDLSVLSGGLLGGGNPVIHLPIFVKVASAQAILDDIQCAGSSDATIDADSKFQHRVLTTVNTEIARIGVGEFNDISAFNPQPPATGQTVDLVSLNPLGLGLLTISAESSDIPLGNGGSESLDFLGPYPSDPPQSVSANLSGALNNGLGALGNDLLAGLDTRGLVGGLLGLVLNLLGVGNENGLLQLVFNILEPVINLLGTALLDPLFNLLGLSLGNADVTVDSVVANQPTIYCTDRQCNAD